MARESTNQAKTTGEEPSSSRPDPPRPEQTTPELVSEARPQDLVAGDVDPATVNVDEEDEGRLPEVTEEGNEVIAEGPLAIGHAAIENAVKLAPTSPGVYRMLDAANDVLYVRK